MLSNSVIFLIGILIFVLFLWYFGTDSDQRKRVIGVILTLFTTAFCLYAVSTAGINRGIDLEGGSQFIVEIKPDGDRLITEAAREEAKAVLLKRLDGFGGNATITNQGEEFLNIQMPGIKEENRAAIRETIEKVAKMELRLVHPNSDQLVPQVRAGAVTEPGYEIIPMRADKVESEGGTRDLLVTLIPDVEGKHVKSAFPYLDVAYAVSVKLNDEGGEIMRNLTAQNVGRRLAIVMDGEIISAPVIQGRFSSEFQITGDFDYDEANSLASVLENPLGNPLEIQDERSVAAEMGADTIKQGVYAGLAGLGMTLLFVLFYYRLAGIIALIGLVVNICLLFGSMAIFGFTLTMPGIAGILLTIGIAVDANVLIFERLREEMRAGKSLPAAIDSAYEKAFSAIFDANVTTLITSIILFLVASSIIKGFAITLTLGILASLFAALLVTRACF
ncbi:MAG: protein translocase subunit SecD, partial [Verrucomicrobiota bacterium]